MELACVGLPCATDVCCGIGAEGTRVEEGREREECGAVGWRVEVVSDFVPVEEVGYVLGFEVFSVDVGT